MRTLLALILSLTFASPALADKWIAPPVWEWTAQAEIATGLGPDHRIKDHPDLEEGNPLS